MAKKYFRIDLFVDASCVLNTKKKKVIVDTFAAGVRFDAGETYTVEYEAGFVKGTENNEFLSPANTNAGSFTTNTTGPQVQTDEPTDGGTNITNNTFIRYTYDRNILAGNGNYYLYKVGSPDSLIATYNPSDSTANNTISGNQITLVTTGLIEANQTYYVLIDAGAVEDKDGLPAPGFSNDQEHRWTTAPSTNVDFPDLISLQASSGTLTCEGTKNLNYENAQATLSGQFSISADYKTLYINVPAVTYTFVGNIENNPFSSNAIFIEDSGDSSARYNLDISINTGSLNNKLLGQTFSVTNKTKAQINTEISNLEFYPLRDQTSTTTLGFTLTDYATSTQLQQKNVSISYSGTDDTSTLSGANITVNSDIGYTYGLPILYGGYQGGTQVSDGTSNLSVFYYATDMRITTIGGGGGGATLSGGGAGGQAIEKIFDTVSGGAYDDIPDNLFRSEDYINVTVGSGGSTGSDGGTTTVVYKQYSSGSYSDVTWGTAGGGTAGSTSGGGTNATNSTSNTTKLDDGAGNTLAMAGGNGGYSGGNGGDPFYNAIGSPTGYIGGNGGTGAADYFAASYVAKGGRGYGRDNAGLSTGTKYLTSLGSGGYSGSSSESPTAGRPGGYMITLGRS